MNKYTGIVLFFTILLSMEAPRCDGANILGIFGSHSPSHVIVHMAMMKTLADRGHNITVVTQMKPKLKAHENITVVLAPPTPEREQYIKDYMSKITTEKTSIWATLLKAIVQSGDQLEAQYEFAVHPNFREIYENPQTKFDLVFLGMMGNDFQLGVAAKLKCPAIITWVGVPMLLLDSIVGNVADPTYVPSLNVALEPGQITMRFGQRLLNFFKHSFLKFVNVLMNYKMNVFYE